MKKSILLLTTALVSLSSFAQESKEDGAEYNQYGQKVETMPAEAKFQDGILAFENKKNDFKFWFDIRVQGDAAFYFGGPDFTAKTLDGASNPNHIGNGASFRRTRFAVKAQLGKNWYGELDTDWTSGTVEIKDAILGFTGVEGLEVKMGNFKENFSINRNTTSRYLMFMERPMVTSLAPSRHLGVAATYSKNWFWGSFGVFGPELKGAEEQTAMEDNNKDFGYDEGLSYTGKLAFRPFYNSKDAALHVAGAFSYREPKTTSTDGYGVARYSTRNSTNINRKKYLDTDVIKGLDHELAWTAELAGHWRGFRYEAAYIARGAFLDRTINDKDAQWMKGWYAQASYLLFGGTQNFDYSGGKPTRVNPGKKWGDVELALCYQTCDFNSKDYFGGASNIFGVGLNIYPTRNVKFMINYQYVNNDRYANGKGKLYVGHDANGNPTKDYTKVVESDGDAGVDYSMLAFRFQVAF